MLLAISFAENQRATSDDNSEAPLQEDNASTKHVSCAADSRLSVQYLQYEDVAHERLVDMQCVCIHT